MKITLRTQYHAQSDADKVGVLGDCASLGLWNPALTVVGIETPAKSGNWVMTFDGPSPHSPIYFKLVVVRGEWGDRRVTRWEDCADRLMPCSQHVLCPWNGGAVNDVDGVQPDCGCEGVQATDEVEQDSAHEVELLVDDERRLSKAHRALVSEAHRGPVFAAGQGPVSEAEQCSVSETDLCPVSEADEGPVSEADQCLVSDPDQDLVSGADICSVSETDQCSISKTDQCPISETDQCPISETDQCPISETDQCPISETDQCPISEADTCPISETDQCPISETDQCPISEADTCPISETYQCPISETDQCQCPISETDQCPISKMDRGSDSEGEQASLSEAQGSSSEIGQSCITESEASTFFEVDQGSLCEDSGRSLPPELAPADTDLRTAAAQQAPMEPPADVHPEDKTTPRYQQQTAQDPTTNCNSISEEYISPDTQTETGSDANAPIGRPYSDASLRFCPCADSGFDDDQANRKTRQHRQQVANVEIDTRPFGLVDTSTDPTTLAATHSNELVETLPLDPLTARTQKPAVELTVPDEERPTDTQQRAVRVVSDSADVCSTGRSRSREAERESWYVEYAVPPVIHTLYVVNEPTRSPTSPPTPAPTSDGRPAALETADPVGRVQQATAEPVAAMPVTDLAAPSPSRPAPLPPLPPLPCGCRPTPGCRPCPVQQARGLLAVGCPPTTGRSATDRYDALRAEQTRQHRTSSAQTTACSASPGLAQRRGASPVESGRAGAYLPRQSDRPRAYSSGESGKANASAYSVALEAEVKRVAAALVQTTMEPMLAASERAQLDETTAASELEATPKYLPAPFLLSSIDAWLQLEDTLVTDPDEQAATRHLA